MNITNYNKTIDGVIYCTTNLINGKKYIGYDSRNRDNYFGSGSLIKQAIKKYGKENFIKQILENCTTVQNLLEAEQYWIAYFNAQQSDLFYNITAGGEMGDTISHHPNKDIIIQKTVNGLKKYYETHNSVRKGVTLSKKTKKLLSIRTLQYVEKFGSVNKGIKKTQEHKNKLSKSSSKREKIKCKYCSQLFDIATIDRWHNENCKHNPNISQSQLEKRNSWNKGKKGLQVAWNKGKKIKKAA